MGLRALVVDDEALARARLRSLLAECTEPVVTNVAEAADAVQAAAYATLHEVDVVLLDIHMPGADGLALARQLRALPKPPAVVFVTAWGEHAVQAFELDALDYLTKPVRRERLQQALQKVQRFTQIARGLEADLAEESLLIPGRSRMERVPLSQVLYLKAELKYVTVRTAAHSYILEAALGDLEARYPQRFLRIHRNALVARWALRALERQLDAPEAEGWAVRLQGVPEVLAVSRRQLLAVREELAGAH
jgi:two-component system response regulator AlgR